MPFLSFLYFSLFLDGIIRIFEILNSEINGFTRAHLHISSLTIISCLSHLTSAVLVGDERDTEKNHGTSSTVAMIVRCIVDLICETRVLFLAGTTTTNGIWKKAHQL